MTAVTESKFPGVTLSGLSPEDVANIVEGVGMLPFNRVMRTMDKLARQLQGPKVPFVVEEPK